MFFISTVIIMIYHLHLSFPTSTDFADNYFEEKYTYYDYDMWLSDLDVLRWMH